MFEPIRIPFPVRECTDYLDKRLPCVEDLEDIAWLLGSKSAGKNAGFVSVTANELEEASALQVEAPAAKR
jgi:hypothetical protein